MTADLTGGYLNFQEEVKRPPQNIFLSVFIYYKVFLDERKYLRFSRALCLLGAALVVCALPLLLYPRRYGDIIVEECARNSVPPALVYAVIYAESGFDPNAVSPKGATGLMQLMPATAAWCAQKADIAYDRSKLTEPEYNIELGVHYLSYLLERFDERDAVAAYNAGEGNVAAWRACGLSEIPFSETDAYVNKVFRAKKVYEFLIKSENLF